MITEIEVTTIVLWLVYLVYEFYFVSHWQVLQDDGTMIRLDLVFIWPTLAILTLISIVQEISQQTPY